MSKTSYPLFIVTLTTLSAVIAHSQLPPTSTSQTVQQSASESRFDAIVPVCYIRLENGQLRDLRQLCGKKPTGLPSSLSVQRPVTKPNPDTDDDDDPTPSVSSTPRTTPLPRSPNNSSTPQVTPPTPPTQPTGSPLPGAVNRPTIAPSPATPAPFSTLNPLSSPIPSATPNPLAIPDNDSRY